MTTPPLTNDFTIKQWCEKRGLSLSSYYALRRDGNGPDELRVPGTNIIRITPKADAEWEARMQQVTAERADELEARRRRAAEAGRKAAESPRHVSKRGRGVETPQPPQRRRRQAWAR